MANRHLVGIVYRAFGRALALAVLGILAVLLNPFDLNSWSDNRSRAIWQELYAPVYPAYSDFLALFNPPDPQEVQRRIGLNRITTVVFDDGSGVTTGGIRTINLINMITQLALEPRAAGSTGPVLPLPRAVFFDFSPSDQPVAANWRPRGNPGPVPCGSSTDSDEQLATCLLDKVVASTRYDRWQDNGICQNNPLEKLRCIQAAGGVPIMFGHIGPVTDLAPGGLAYWLDQVGLLVNIADLHENGDLALVDAAAEKATNRRWSMTPPVALYLADCVATFDINNMPEHCRPLGSLLTDKSDTLPTVFDAPILPVAGLRPDTKQAKLLEGIELGTEGQRCITANQVRRAILAYLPSVILPDLFDREERPLCPYNDRLRLQTLSLAAGQMRVDIHEAMLAGRLILVGDDRSITADRHDLPPFKRLAGVHLLAMATDNLLEHAHEPPRKLDRLDEAGLTGLAVFVISFVVGSLRGAFEQPPSRWPYWVLFVLLVLCSIIMLLSALLLTPPLRLTGLKTILVLLFLIGSLMDLYMSVAVTIIKAKLLGGRKK